MAIKCATPQRSVDVAHMRIHLFTLSAVLKLILLKSICVRVYYHDWFRKTNIYVTSCNGNITSKTAEDLNYFDLKRHHCPLLQIHYISITNCQSAGSYGAV